MRTAVGVVVVCLLFLVSPAEAHKVARWDPNDSASRLDIRRFTYAHQDDVVRGEIVSFDDWGPYALNRKNLEVWTDFLTSEDYRGEGEYEIKFRYRRSMGDYVGNVWYSSETQPAYEWVGRARVWRPDGSTLRWEADQDLFTADLDARGVGSGSADVFPSTRSDRTRGLHH